MRALLVAVLLASGCTAGNPGRGRTNGGTGASGGTNGASNGGTNGGCQGLGCYKVSCPGGATTSVSGRVTAPNGRDPVYEALVYVPSTVPEFPPHVECEACNEPIGGTPVVSAVSAVDGSFRLTDVPATMNVPIVIQKGRFRRTVNLNITACTDAPLTIDQARLPRNQQEGDLPKMAVAVGDFDQIECVLRSFGIDDREFTVPGGNGAVHLYRNGSFDGLMGGTEFSDLLLDGASMRQYNLMFINCTGFGWEQLSSQTMAAANLLEYVRSGGRLYATDYAYDFLEQVKEFSPYIYFDGGGSVSMPQPVTAARTGSDTSDFPATVADPILVQWLQAAGATTGSTITISDLLPDWVLVDSTANMDPYPSQTWIRGTTNGAERPLSITFDYNMCGRVLFSSYHTREPGGADPFDGGPFPTYCKSSPTNMTAQEKVLEFLILHISSCLGPVG